MRYYTLYKKDPTLEENQALQKRYHETKWKHRDDSWWEEWLEGTSIISAAKQWAWRIGLL